MPGPQMAVLWLARVEHAKGRVVPAMVSVFWLVMLAVDGLRLQAVVLDSSVKNKTTYVNPPLM